MNFEIGQTFTGNYPPQVSDWCEQNNAQLKQISDDTFQLVQSTYILTFQQQCNIYQNSIQRLIDQTARSKGYENGSTLATYILSTNQVWKKEADIFIKWRDAVWTHYHDIINAIDQSTVENYPSVQQIIQQLPKIEWQ